MIEQKDMHVRGLGASAFLFERAFVDELAMLGLKIKVLK